MLSGPTCGPSGQRRDLVRLLDTGVIGMRSSEARVDAYEPTSLSEILSYFPIRRWLQAFVKAFYLASAELADIYARPPLLSESVASDLLERYPDYSNAYGADGGWRNAGQCWMRPGFAKIAIMPPGKTRIPDL